MAQESRVKMSICGFCNTGHHDSCRGPITVNTGVGDPRKIGEDIVSYLRKSEAANSRVYTCDCACKQREVSNA